MKGYRDNGAGAGGFGPRNKTVYDDVFGGPPKFGATTLPPRLEDYTEIFHGFHASRGSSIPVLDLPPPAVDSEDVWFDVQSSKLDYSEVFGGCNGLDFALSYEELFESSKVGDDDSSDEVWTPAQSESLSDESDPHASLEMNQQASTADPIQSSGVKLKNEPNFEVEKDFLNDMKNDSQCLDVSGSTVLNNHALPSKKENEKFFSLANNDLCASKDFGEVAEGKTLKKSLSQPLDSGCGTEIYGNQKDYPVGNRPLLSVSDLSLKTQPSHLPPPSRPPPSLTSKKGDSSNFSSKLKTSKSYAFERRTDDHSPPFFDVEIDASSSAAADCAAMKDAVEQAQAKLRSAKALMDRKKEGLQSRSKLQMKYNVGDNKVKVNENYEKSNGFEGERMKGSFESDTGITRHEVREENQQNAVILEPNAGSAGSKKSNNVVFEYFEQKEDNEIVQETVDRSQKKEGCLKEHTVAHKTPNDSDENEMYENLIEIQLKDNDIITVEEVVTETWLKNDDNGSQGGDMGSASNVWVDYDVEPEEATEKENKVELKETEEQDEKEFQQSGPPEISLIQSEEEEDSEREEGERIVKESDNISETVSEQDVNKKEQTLNHNEKILLEEDEIKIESDDNVQTVHEVETIREVDCNSGENIKSQKESVSENDDIEDEQEGIKWDEDESITGENSELQDVVFQLDDNEILHDKGNVQQDAPSEEHEVTPETPFSEKIKETVERIHEVGEESFSSKQTDLPFVKVEARAADVIKQAPTEMNGTDFTTTTTDFTTTTTKPATDQNTDTASKVAENRGKEERLQRARELENKRVRKIEEERERENVRLRELENERVRKIEEERERENARLRELENERLRKIEEERERQIEREKDRMAVDRATLEAREKAFAETRERAAAERATAEFRQRTLAEARERLEKACAEARERSLADKAMEGRLRVEKATAEARERAVAEKFSYQNTGIRQNSLPSDLAGSYSGLRYYQAPSQGGEGESPQRCKARLERHQRTADRAAKALAEKNMRDLIAQKEQAERSRLAEGLDAEVKRWSNGKQGNLRALLSTLQYILGADSGWQPVPLTEVITTAAVKKAYRKATLCVHPDKLQQRGATIQQKYICEKVFDLLKEAWNKFNSEER
ncbi:hypothetical protein L1987_18271 [Smallanthus sonchifolius]|uniref:Uncharacterized protein n=1 Tax=Smallanthus sonchifolius TaxID=185202 RepID=A0ACB9J1V8_9ASTR|nr:hypothetical protein L1987_18271 [Smallanthus sonchifolius]